MFTQSTNNGFSYHVYTAAPNGASRRKVSSRRAVGRPSMSADGTRLAFAGPLTDDSNGRYSLYVVGVNGGSLRRITGPTYADMDPAWSPDGRWIAFSRLTRGNLNSPCCMLGKISTDGRRTTRLINNTTGGTWPSWSPDSRNLVFAGPGAAHDPGRRGQALPAGARQRDPAGLVAERPPGRRRAAHRGQPLPHRDRQLHRRRDQGRRRPCGMVETPAWSPDSRSIFFVQFTGLGDDGRRAASVAGARRPGGQAVRLPHPALRTRPLGPRRRRP